MAPHYPAANATDTYHVFGNVSANLMTEVLRRTGDTPTHENPVRQATSPKDVKLPMLLPANSVDTSSTAYTPIPADTAGALRQSEVDS